MDDEYDIDCTGTEDDVIERETGKALGAGAMSAAAVRGTVGPLVRIILALLAAIGGGSVREALARANALLAPVDVEKEVERVNGQIVNCDSTFEVLALVRPLVADRARLAREVERLRGERRRTEQALRSDIAAFREDRNAARAELARLTSDLDSLAQDVGQALCAATLRPGETITDQRPHAIVSLVVDLVGEKHAMGAEIRRLTAAPGEAGEAARVAMIHAMNGASLAHAALSDAWSRYDQTPRTAAPGEAWERLRERAKALAEDAEAITGAAHLSKVHTDMLAELRAALAAVEPQVEPTGGVWALPGYVGPGGCPTRENDPGQLHGTTCGSASPLTIVEQRESIASAPGQIGPRWPLCVDCSTDGATQHIRTEAVGTVERCASCDQGGIMYAPPGWTTPPDEVTDAELADAIERTSGDGALAWPGSILRRLALAEQARRAAPAMTTERAREVAAIRARHADESGAFCGVAYSWRQAHEDRAALLSILSADVTREALAATPTPPRALTEAEARAWVDLRFGRTWEYGQAVVTMLTRTARGDVPPEVRRYDHGVDCPCLACSAQTAAMREMAVTTGEAERAPDACGHGTLSSWPCDDCERETEPPTGVPGIAGPAGLDAASGPPPEYWDKGVAVEREVVFVDRREGIVITAPKSPRGAQ